MTGTGSPSSTWRQQSRAEQSRAEQSRAGSWCMPLWVPSCTTRLDWLDCDWTRQQSRTPNSHTPQAGRQAGRQAATRGTAGGSGGEQQAALTSCCACHAPPGSGWRAASWPGPRPAAAAGPAPRAPAAAAPPGPAGPLAAPGRQPQAQAPLRAHQALQALLVQPCPPAGGQRERLVAWAAAARRRPASHGP